MFLNILFVFFGGEGRLFCSRGDFSWWIVVASHKIVLHIFRTCEKLHYSAYENHIGSAVSKILISRDRQTYKQTAIQTDKDFVTGILRYDVANF